MAPERKGEPVRTVTDKKAGYSTMCRTGLHRLCIVSTCACVICHRSDTEKWRAYREAHKDTINEYQRAHRKTRKAAL